MRGSVKPAPKPRFRLEKRGDHWCVVARISGLVYSSLCYAKAVGVFEFLEQRRVERHRLLSLGRSHEGGS
jgi:hypothetical protein